MTGVGTAEELAAAGLLNYKKPEDAGRRKSGLFGRFRRGGRGKVVATEGSAAGSYASTSASTMQARQDDPVIPSSDPPTW